MTDFWPGQDPWSSFEQNPSWDGAGEPQHSRADQRGDYEAASSPEPAHEIVFVQQAIQRVYHP